MKWLKRKKKSQPIAVFEEPDLREQRLKASQLPALSETVDDVRTADAIEKADENIATMQDYYPDIFKPPLSSRQIMQRAMRIHAQELVRAAHQEIIGAGHYLTAQLNKDEAIKQFERQLDRAQGLLRQARAEVDVSKHPESIEPGPPIKRLTKREKHATK